MKISTDRKEGFKPVTLSITMENMQELCTIFSIFNFTPITNYIEKYCGAEITKDIRESLYINGNWPPYGEFHSELNGIWRK